MNAILIFHLIIIPVIFILGRFSASYRFIRVRRRFRQNVRDFISGR